MALLSTELAGIELRNPLLPASGPITRDGDAMLKTANSGVGGLVAKTVSTEPAEVPRPYLAKEGNSLINSDLWSELPLERWIEEEYPKALEADLPLIASVGHTPEEIGEIVGEIEEVGVDAFEVVSHRSEEDPSVLVESVSKAKEIVDKPVFAKIGLNKGKVSKLATSLEDAGADGIVALGSIGPSLSIDTSTERPVMGSKNGYGWLSGPAIKPLAVRYVAEIAQAVDIPIIGSGGIKDEEDVAEFLMAGASAVQICTAAITRGSKIFGLIADNFEGFMNGRGYDTVEELQGAALGDLPDEPTRTTAEQPDVLTSRCTGCGLCKTNCTYEAVTVTSDSIRIDSTACTGCGLCISVCPERALRF